MTPLSESLNAVAIRELGEKVCPGCRGPKFKGKSFCVPCYYRLPTDIRANLYQRFGDGYSVALHEAKDWLRQHSNNSSGGEAA